MGTKGREIVRMNVDALMRLLKCLILLFRNDWG